ncbi:unnamed protein product [Boreogadus saida]
MWFGWGGVVWVEMTLKQKRSTSADGSGGRVFPSGHYWERMVKVVAGRGRQVSVRDGAGIRQLAAILARPHAYGRSATLHLTPQTPGLQYVPYLDPNTSDPLPMVPYQQQPRYCMTEQRAAPRAHVLVSSAKSMVA